MVNKADRSADSTHMMIMEEPSLLLLERTFPSLLVIRGRVRDTVFRLDMLERCINCEYQLERPRVELRNQDG